ncbi:MAG: hypothetical protein NWE94_08765 [Candidatus Bathyarchaeota archaeon]|nr:hypothetical protein [Candidatus Bathyarchaeota archaeon]
MSEKYIRVKTWEDFKRLGTELKPEAVVYSIDQNGMSKTKELTCLRLILPASSGYYVYLDFPKDGALRETGIPIREDRLGNRCLRDEDVTRFLRDAFGRADLQVYSFWTT